MTSEARDEPITPTNIPGDANGDGMVDVGDLGILGGNWGTLTGMTWADGDFTGDGAVDVGDLGVLGGNWGFGTGGSPEPFPGINAIPEPTVMVLLSVGVLGLLRRRR